MSGQTCRCTGCSYRVGWINTSWKGHIFHECGSQIANTHCALNRCRACTKAADLARNDSLQKRAGIGSPRAEVPGRALLASPAHAPPPGTPLPSQLQDPEMPRLRAECERLTAEVNSLKQELAMVWTHIRCHQWQTGRQETAVALADAKASGASAASGSAAADRHRSHLGPRPP